jgi:hypothetical protein
LPKRNIVPPLSPKQIEEFVTSPLAQIWQGPKNVEGSLKAAAQFSFVIPDKKVALSTFEAVPLCVWPHPLTAKFDPKK